MRGGIQVKLNPIVHEMMKKNNNHITTSQFLSLGYSKTLLGKYVKAGLLERCNRGVYILPETLHDDMYTLMLKSKWIVFSHDTALFLNGLSDRTPFTHSVTIPSNAALSESLRMDCICFYVKPMFYEIGLSKRRTTFGNDVRCYNAERTICDLLRSRSRCDEETVISAVKNYMNYKDKDLNLLSVYTNQFKVNNELRKYMEVLL